MGLIVVFLAVLCIPVNAGVLEFSGISDQRLDTSDFKLAIYPTAVVNIPEVTPEGGIPVYLTGAGLREKSIVLFSVDVYYATSYLNQKVKLNEKQPMDQIRKSSVRAIQLTLLRDLSGEKIRDSFKDALEENGISVETPGFKKLFEQIDGEVKERTTVTIVGYTKKDGSQGILYSLPSKTVQVEEDGIADKFWLVWFGKPADSGLEKLKQGLMGKTALTKLPSQLLGE